MGAKAHVLAPFRAGLRGEGEVAWVLLRFDVPGRLDHVLQCLGPMDDRSELPGLDELVEEEDVLLRLSRWDLEHPLLVSDTWRPQGQDEILESVGGQVDAGWLERIPAALERVLADRIEDDVVRLAVLREVFLRVVDHPVRSQRFHELQVFRVAHSGDVSVEVPGQLHTRGADGSGRPADYDPAPLPQICRGQ